MANPYGLSDHDAQAAGIPIYGWLSGADARRDAAMNRYEQQKAERTWSDLVDGAPGAEDLAVDYQGIGTGDEYGNLLGGPSQLEGLGSSADQLEALRQLQGLSRGGFTDADRAMMRTAHAQNAQQMGAANAAATNAAYARGMGGGGALLAGQMANAQGMASANAGYDAQAMMGAQMRALQALSGYTSQANALQQQEMQRRGAIDAFNQRNMDWRRGRAETNAQWGNRSAESASNARQQAYENRERGAAGMTNQYQAAQSNRRQDAARQDQSNQAAASGLGSLISEIL